MMFLSSRHQMVREKLLERRYQAQVQPMHYSEKEWTWKLGVGAEKGGERATY